nr:MAG TPA: hypothetical protein [Bacteriophage sp.]
MLLVSVINQHQTSSKVHRVYSFLTQHLVMHQSQL